MQSFTKKHNFHKVFDAQQVFRQILTAVSNPTRVVNIGEAVSKLYGENPELLAIALTLLDNEVSFCACENRRLAEEIASLTLSREEELAKADFLFLTGGAELGRAIQDAKCGTLRDPHRSATVVVKDAGERACTLRLRGPGIAGSARLLVTQRAKIALAARDAQHYEYPQGIDFIFVSGGGDLFAVPRLTDWEEI